MKVAVLLPSSTTHSQMSYDFYQSMQLVVEKSEFDVEWLSASIGFGIDDGDILTKAEDLLLNKRADVLIAFADYPKVTTLFPLLEACNREMLIVNMGSKLPDDWMIHPRVTHLNLQEALLARSTGMHPRAGGGVFFSNQYDGGYAMGQLLVDAYLAQGGEIISNFIPKAVSIAAFDMAPLLDYLKNLDKEANLLLVQSNPVTSAFWKEWIQISKRPLMRCNSTFLMESLAAHSATLLANQVFGHFAWDKDSSINENVTFVRCFEEEFQREASFFGALGWDAGLILLQAISRKVPGAPLSIARVFATEDSQVELSRGAAMLDAGSNTIIAGSYFLQIENGEKQVFSVSAQDNLNTWADIKRLYPIPNPAGWFNTYLCS